MIELRRELPAAAQAGIGLASGILEGLAEKQAHEQQRREAREDALYALQLQSHQLRIQNAAHLDLQRDLADLQQNALAPRQARDAHVAALRYMLGQVHKDFTAGLIDGPTANNAVWQALSTSPLAYDPSIRELVGGALQSARPGQAAGMLQYALGGGQPTQPDKPDQDPLLRRVASFDALVQGGELSAEEATRLKRAAMEKAAGLSRATQEGDDLSATVAQLEQLAAAGYIPKDQLAGYIQAAIRKATAGTATIPGRPDARLTVSIMNDVIKAWEESLSTEDFNFSELPYSEKVRLAWPIAVKLAEQAYSNYVGAPEPSPGAGAASAPLPPDVWRDPLAGTGLEAPGEVQPTPDQVQNQMRARPDALDQYADRPAVQEMIRRARKGDKRAQDYLLSRKIRW